jgi:hypothetical protein
MAGGGDCTAPGVRRNLGAGAVARLHSTRRRSRYVTVYRFDGDGRVVSWREYFDAGVVVCAFAPQRQSVE